jgi:ABC-2 type transport system permease protein
MVRKDLARQVRSPLAMTLVLAFPLLFSGLLALAFGGSADPRIRKVELLVEDRDGSWLSGLVVSAAGSERVAEHFDVRAVEGDGLALLEAGEASALLRIPEGFGEDLLDGRPVTLELVRNPAQGILPEIAEQASAVLAEVLSAASSTLREPLSEVAALVREERDPALEDTLGIAARVHEIVEGSSGLIFPPAIAVETVTLRDEEAGRAGGSRPSGMAGVFTLVLPGISVWALFLVGDLAMRDLLREATGGTLRRQLVAPVPAGRIVLAKASFAAVLSAISLVVLAAVGWVSGGRGVDPLGFVALSAALIVAVTGFASTVYGLAATERQGATLASVVLLAFAFLGGSFVQVDMLPQDVRRFAPLSLFYWGTTGYRDLLGEGAGVGDLLPNLAVLAGVGTALLALGGALLGRKVRRGAA